jgi:thiol-disulfide isomerase/thioredoxin
VSTRILRLIRGGALLGICLLAGVYAGQRLLRDGDPPPEPAGAAASLVDELPDFTLSDLDGTRRSLRSWRDDALLINFWATWCAPCRREMPLLQRLHDERRDLGLQVIGVAVDRLPDVQAYIQESGISYPILVGQQDAMDAAEAFGPEFVGLPFTVLVAAGGRVLGLRAGELEAPELRQIVETMDRVDSGGLSVADARALLGTN